MAKLTAETVKALAEQLYDYKLADDAAESIAHMVGAIAAARIAQPCGDSTAARLRDAAGGGRSDST
jgi:hypothetical protein